MIASDPDDPSCHGVIQLVKLLLGYFNGDSYPSWLPDGQTVKDLVGYHDEHLVTFQLSS